MLRRNIGVVGFATALTLISGMVLSAPARQVDNGRAAHGRSFRDCVGAGERAAPMMASIFGKPVTVSIAPLDVLVTVLKLDAAQKKRMDAIQAKLDKDIGGSARQSRGGDITGQLAGLKETLSQADQDAESVLTGDQKAMLPALLTNLTVMRDTGVPPELYNDLKLSDEQMKKLSEVVKDVKQEQKERATEMMAAGQAGDMKKVQKLMNALSDKVIAILTKEQVALVEKYRKKHAQMMMPGMGLPGI